MINIISHRKVTHQAAKVSPDPDPSSYSPNWWGGSDYLGQSGEPGDVDIE